MKIVGVHHDESAIILSGEERRSMSQASILLISNDTAFVRGVSQTLTSAGYHVTHVTSQATALRHVQVYSPDLAIVHVPLGGAGETELCKRLKHDALAPLPIILLTDRNEEASLIVGLALGIDDYLMSPFSPQLLLALVQAVLRRMQPSLESDVGAIDLEGLHIHTGHHEVHVNDRRVRLTPTEFRIFSLLVHSPEQTWSRQQIVLAMRGDHANVTLRSVDAHIAALRRKLGAYRRNIKTVRGVGYRLRSPDE
jgi:DNA-binding response OmpR family regulator